MWWKMQKCGAAIVVLSVLFAGCGMMTEATDQLSGPYAYKNLTIFLVAAAGQSQEKAMLTLEEALASKSAVVYETGEVEELEVENTSDLPVFIQSGDMVKGGRQDRMLRYDFVVSPHSGKQSIDAFCVNQGRWTKRGEESADKFEKTADVLACISVKKAALIDESQSKVWSEVAKMSDKLDALGGRLPVSDLTGSLPCAIETDSIKYQSKEYDDAIIRQIKSSTKANGIVVIINGKFHSADLYRSPDLFQKLFPKLLDGAAIEALAEYEDGKQYPSVSVDTVNQWLAGPGAKEIGSKLIGGKTFVTKFETEKTVCFESKNDTLSTQWLHKTIMTKEDDK
jgi:hypothetical protein